MAKEKIYEDVANYYDKLWGDLEKEAKTGVLSRHRMILLKLKQAGFKSKSTLLEIGCGIGTLSSYLAKVNSAGKVDAVDISPATIEFAKNKYKGQKNLEFFVSDMTNFSIVRKYDFILFPDVLEHIPVEAHDNIFNTIKNLCHENSIVAINLPTARSLRWFHKNNPEALQIIDQDIESDSLIGQLYKHGFYLISKETYSLYFVQPDYEWFVFKVQREFNKMELKSKMSVLLNNIKLRILNLLN